MISARRFVFSNRNLLQYDTVIQSRCFGPVQQDQHCLNEHYYKWWNPEKSLRRFCCCDASHSLLVLRQNMHGPILLTLGKLHAHLWQHLAQQQRYIVASKPVYSKAELVWSDAVVLQKIQQMLALTDQCVTVCLVCQQLQTAPISWSSGMINVRRCGMTWS